MQVDILIPNFEDLGAQRVAINAANGLFRAGYGVRFVVTEGRGPFRAYLDPAIEVLNLEHHIWQVPKVRVLLWIAAYAWLLRRGGPRVVVSFSPITNVLAMVPRLLWRRRIRTVVQEHAYQSVALHDREVHSPLFVFLYKQIFVRLYRRADVFLTIAEAIREDFIRTFAIPAAKTEVIPNPLDIAGLEVLRKDAPEGFAFRDGVHYLIGVGRLAEQKNFLRLLRIFAAVRDVRDDVELLILGRGAGEAPLRAAIAEAGLGDVVHLQGFRQNPYAYMARSTLFCLTSDWEGLPQVIAEAMVCGVPVVAHACPSGPDEMIENGKTGVLVPYKDEAAFAKAIGALLDDPKARSAMAEAARDWAVKEYGMDTFLARYKAMLEKLAF